MKKCSLIFKVIISFFFIVLVSCNGGKKNGEAVKDTETLPDNIVEMRADQIRVADINTGTIEQRLMSGTLKVSGTITVSPENLATVCVPMGGFIKSTNLMPGSAVRKGQTLAVVENQEFIELQQKYLECSSQLEYSEAEYKRQKELYKENVSAAKTFQQTTADFKILRAQVKALGQKLALIGINADKLRVDNITRSVALKSPISGYIKTVNVNIGKFVSPTDVLFEIVNSNKLFLELTLFEKDADKVSKGQKIHFFTNNMAEQHEAVVYQTDKSINADKTCKVHACVTCKCKNILPGMYVNATIDASTDKVTALPSEAVVNFDDKDYIFIFDKNKKENGNPITQYRMIEVHKGVVDRGYTQVILPQNFNIKTSKVVTRGAYNLLSAKK
ncbi:MAG: efflux RND transporter periplasmic adaptor subunit, partial [Bacteroidota bacterium]|nr:efflux RND transporter periplasmic adaptor subunit [Bacteroidota bacterium]